MANKHLSGHGKRGSPKNAKGINLYELLTRYGQLYSDELGIDIKKEPFKWFLASILFGARISTSIAEKTYRAYEQAGLTSPSKLALSDEMTLIKIHGRSGYARYDGITADYVLGMVKKLLEDYDGEIRKLDEVSIDPRDLELRLQEFRGVGPITAKIFLRELRGIWRNADPEPTVIEVLAAKNLGILKSDGDALERLKEFWNENAIEGYSFRHFEAALLRLGLELRRKNREK
jgi:endonuclease III